MNQKLVKQLLQKNGRKNFKPNRQKTRLIEKPQRLKRRLKNGNVLQLPLLRLRRKIKKTSRECRKRPRKRKRKPRLK